MSHGHTEGLSVLLPVHNQAAVLERGISAWSTLLAKLGLDYEIVLIDDGSTDATKKLLDGDAKNGLRDRIPHLRILNHPDRRGYGASLRTGLSASQFPLIFCTGFDYAYNPQDLRTLLERIAEADPATGKKIDLVSGYRARNPMTGWRKQAGRLWRFVLRAALGLDVPARPGWLGAPAHRYAFLVRMLFGPRVGDVDSKFKLFRKSIFERIPIQSDGDFVHAEILAKANFLGCLMDEVPIADRPGSFAACAEPAGPKSRWREMRKVFFNPDFGTVCATSSGAVSA
jgi:glycosyltransferase involved in cell wall biosynthesis